MLRKATESINSQEDVLCRFSLATDETPVTRSHFGHPDNHSVTEEGEKQIGMGLREYRLQSLLRYQRTALRSGQK